MLGGGAEGAEGCCGAAQAGLEEGGEVGLLGLGVHLAGGWLEEGWGGCLLLGGVEEGACLGVWGWVCCGVAAEEGGGLVGGWLGAAEESSPRWLILRRCVAAEEPRTLWLILCHNVPPENTIASRLILGGGVASKEAATLVLLIGSIASK